MYLQRTVVHLNNFLSQNEIILYADNNHGMPKMKCAQITRDSHAEIKAVKLLECTLEQK